MINKKKAVVIGGGNGSALLARACKQNQRELEIAAVVAVSDSGGSSGILRREFNTLPAGDILRAVLAMSRHDYRLLKQVFYKTRFSGQQKLDGHNLGNLFLVLAEKYGGSFIGAVRALEASVGAVGKVYPVSLATTDLCVELSNGDIIKGEADIDVPGYPREHKIKKIWLQPEVEVYHEAAEKIASADYLILSSGSLFTSVIATLLPAGVKAAIAKSRAKLIYTPGDAYELKGETGPESLSGLVKALEQFLPRPLDLIIYNNHVLNNLQQEKYRTHHWAPFRKDLENLPGHKIVGADYMTEDGSLSDEKLGRILKAEMVKL